MSDNDHEIFYTATSVKKPKDIVPANYTFAPRPPAPKAPKQSRWPEGYRRPKALVEWTFQAVYAGIIAFIIIFPLSAHYPEDLGFWMVPITYCLIGIVFAEWQVRCENRALVRKVSIYVAIAFVIFNLILAAMSRSRHIAE